MSVNYSIPAIPTIYNNRQYRSRLEARWAAMFDLLGWPVEYEPFDLRGWIPDFLISGHTPTLVEVKPITAFDWDTGNKMYQAVKDLIVPSPRYPQDRRCDQVQYELLLLGATLGPKDDGCHGVPTLGWLWDGGYYEKDKSWELACATYHSKKFQGVSHPVDTRFVDNCDPSNRELCIGFAHPYNSYHDRVTGAYDGNVENHDPEDCSIRLNALWALAGNLVQWKKLGITK